MLKQWGENSIMNRYNSIFIEDNDNVVTTLWNIEKGEAITAMGLEDKVIAKENIKKGHKVAIKEISKDNEAIKYGKVIGITLSHIGIGELVHTHNLRSNRGKELREGQEHA